MTTQAAPPVSDKAAGPSEGDIVVFRGMCDASGAVPLGGWLFAVADDEDNLLRVYDAGAPGEPVYSVDVSPALALKKRSQEVDLEAATRIDSLAFWLTSHGRNKKGKPRPARLRFFATSAPGDGRVELAGAAYSGLLEDLVASPSLARFDLAAAAEKAPKEPGGLNIEGMTARPEGGVLIGFRNPVPGGRALVVPLLNPEDIVLHGHRARLGQPMLLDLGGAGVRSLSWWRGRYLIIAGAITTSMNGSSPSRLYSWDGHSTTPRPVKDADLYGLNPEAFVSPEDKEQILLLSDDGTVAIDGVPCKSLKNSSHKRFRGMWLRLPWS